MTGVMIMGLMLLLTLLACRSPVVGMKSSMDFLMLGSLLESVRGYVSMPEWPEDLPAKMDRICSEIGVPCPVRVSRVLVKTSAFDRAVIRDWSRAVRKRLKPRGYPYRQLVNLAMDIEFAVDDSYESGM